MGWLCQLQESCTALESVMARDEKPGNKVEMGTLSHEVAFTLDDDGRCISNFSLVEGDIYNKILSSRRVRHENQHLPEMDIQELSPARNLNATKKLIVSETSRPS